MEEPTTVSVVLPFRRENLENPARMRPLTTEVRSSEAIIGDIALSGLRTEEFVCEEYLKSKVHGNALVPG